MTPRPKAAPPDPVWREPDAYWRGPVRLSPDAPPGFQHVSTQAQERARRFARTGGTLIPRWDEPWHALPRAEQMALERAARAHLLAALPPDAAALVRRGRCPQLVAFQMRRLCGPPAPPPGRILVPPAPPPRTPPPPPAPVRSNADADTWDII